jgi:hypothetical protein
MLDLQAKKEKNKMAKHEQMMLPVENAAVQERQVTVRVLTIGTKQVTQTLYRQLVKESVLNEDAEIKGPAWGWVNIHNDCGIKEAHLHVVWESDGVLKRCTICQSHKASNAYKFLERMLDEVGEAYVCAVALEGHWFKNKEGKEPKSPIRLLVNDTTVPVYYSSDVDTYRFRRSSASDTENEFQKLKEMSSEDFPFSYYDSKEDALQSAQAEMKNSQHWCEEVRTNVLRTIEKVTDKISDGFSWSDFTLSKSLFMRMQEIDRAMKTYEQTWKKNYAALETRGQLFVAVSGVWK